MAYPDVNESRRLRVAIEMSPLGPPKPEALGVIRGEHEVVGYLDIDQVRETLAKWVAMEVARMNLRS